MEHTYLRYECADSFGVTVASASSKAPNSNGVMAFTSEGTLLTVAGSCIAGFRLASALAPIRKLGHTLQVAGNMGTGKALNGDELVCLACSQNHVATGWVDGAVRIFEHGGDDNDDDKDRLRAKRSHCPANSLLDDASDCLWQSDPLLLNGHGGSPVRVVLFDADGSRLASGGSDGAVVLWDVVAETGLYRLLGHRRGITDVSFVRTTMDALISCSLDCLIKVWDLEHQCCVQTIVSSSEVLAGACRPVLRADLGDADRWRLIAGGSDGHVRVWSVGQVTNPAGNKIPTDAPVAIDDETGAQIESISMSANENSSVDDLCNFMGFLRVPPNVASSNEKVGGIQFTSGGRYVGVLRGKHVDVFVVRSTAESQRKKARRLKRRQEKSKKKIDGGTAATTKSKKRGILDDDDDDDDAEDAFAGETEGGGGGQHILDPESIKTSDEFEYMATVRASQKLRGFRFCAREKGELCRIVCALATNALETHSVSRKEQVYV
jgi:WD40 repeat protein